MQLRGFAEPFYANALRVGNEYKAATEAFAAGRQLSRNGRDDAGLLDLGRPLEELAVKMLKIFEALNVHREAIAAVILFRDAAAKGAITGDLVHRLQEYLMKARVNPELKFEGCEARFSHQPCSWPSC